MSSEIKDLTGKKFGRWTVVGLNSVKAKNGDYRWDCVCECGARKTVARGNLVAGRSKSCGCYNWDNHTKHGQYIGEGKGLKPDPAYVTWKDMLHRCYNKNRVAYKDYGGRGITVCDRWKYSYENFLHDMGDRPDGKSLERINNNGNYEPLNCMWANNEQQNRNRRNSVVVKIGNLEMVRLEWMDYLNITPGQWGYRCYKQKWIPKKIVKYYIKKNGAKYGGWK